MDSKMTSNEIIKELQNAAEWFKGHGRNTNTAIMEICERAGKFIDEQNNIIECLKAYINGLIAGQETLQKHLNKKKTGGWKVIASDGDYAECKCVNCGYTTIFTEEQEMNDFNYCPSCGAETRKKGGGCDA